MVKCIGTTKAGTSCKANARSGKLYCVTHREQEKEAYAASEEILTRTASSGSEDIEIETESRTHTQQTSSTNITEVVEVIGKLVKKIDNLENKVNEATSNPKKSNKKSPNTKEKKPRKMSEAGAIQSARWAFYREHKDDVEVINTVRGGLQAGSMLIVKKKVVNGREVDVEIIPYALKKMYTDIMFDKLSNRKKQEYIDQAFEKNAEKNAMV
jgi:hypothetical protein